MGSSFGILPAKTRGSLLLKYPGWQSPALSETVHPRWRAAAVGNADWPQGRSLRGALTEEQQPIQQRQTAVMLDAHTIQVCCAELSLPVLPSDRERKYTETIGFYARSLPTFCRDTESRPSERLRARRRRL